MATLRRWRKAQEYERSFWETLARKIESGALSQLDWYAWRARAMEKRLARFLPADTRDTASVLEIGSGPIGIVNFLEWGERFAIDPLEGFYRESNTLTRLRRPAVKYLAAKGEDLPFDDGLFSLVIMDNVIDHTHHPHKILQEIRRVLHKEGLLYLAVNIHTRWGALAHMVLATLYIDAGHPYTFTQETIRDLLAANRFEVREDETEDYHRVKRSQCESESAKERLKGYTGISEFEFYAIAQKV